MSETKVESIMASATRLFAERGVAGVSVQDIADQAGVAAGTIIYHFKTKNNLLFILAREVLYRLCNIAEESIAGTVDPVKGLSSLVDSFFSFANGNRERLIFLMKLDPFSSLDLDSYPNADLVMLKFRYLGMYTKLLASAVYNKKCVDLDPERTTLVIWATLKGVAGMYCESQTVPDLSGEVKAMIAGRLEVSLNTFCQKILCH